MYIVYDVNLFSLNDGFTFRLVFEGGEPVWIRSEISFLAAHSGGTSISRFNCDDIKEVTARLPPDFLCAFHINVFAKVWMLVETFHFLAIGFFFISGHIVGLLGSLEAFFANEGEFEFGFAIILSESVEGVVFVDIWLIKGLIWIYFRSGIVLESVIVRFGLFEFVLLVDFVLDCGRDGQFDCYHRCSIMVIN